MFLRWVAVCVGVDCEVCSIAASWFDNSLCVCVRIVVSFPVPPSKCKSIKLCVELCGVM